MANFRHRARKSDVVPQRKRYFIAVEGETERAYFDCSVFRSESTLIQFVSSKGTDPDSLVSSMESHIEELKRKKELRSGDPAWIVLDHDSRDAEQFSRLSDWSSDRSDRGFALSRPKFEYWVILHSDEGNGISTPKECDDRLKSINPNYQKGKDSTFSNLKEGDVREAIRRAKVRVKDEPDSVEGLLSISSSAVTSVHFLAEQLI